MAVLSDFTVFGGLRDGPNGDYDDPFRVGHEHSLVLQFDTGGRHRSWGLLTFMVRNLTEGRPNVRIRTTNTDHRLGSIEPSTKDQRLVWRHEQFRIPMDALVGQRSGRSSNFLHFGKAVGGPVRTGGGGGPFYEVRDVVCFFHQED